jgi:hypothetical protein
MVGDALAPGKYEMQTAQSSPCTLTVKCSVNGFEVGDALGDAVEVKDVQNDANGTTY